MLKNVGREGDESAGLHKPVPVALHEIRNMSVGERQRRADASTKELEAPKSRATFERLTINQCSYRYWGYGVKTMNLPSQLVCCKKPLHGTIEEWKAKAQTTA